MPQVVQFLDGLWVEFITPSSGKKWKFNPTYFSHLTYSFWRDYSEIFTVLFTTSFLSFSCGKTFNYFPLQVFTNLEMESSPSTRCLLICFPNGKRKIWRLGKTCFCRCLLHFNYLGTLCSKCCVKFLEDKFYIYILHPLSYIKTFP